MFYEYHLAFYPALVDQLLADRVGNTGSSMRSEKDPCLSRLIANAIGDFCTEYHPK